MLLDADEEDDEGDYPETDLPSDGDVESVCILLKTIGPLLDSQEANSKYGNRMDGYFERMTSLSENKGLPSRLRFMLKDMIELRDRDWGSRDKVKPLKLQRHNSTPATTRRGRYDHPNVSHSPPQTATADTPRGRRLSNNPSGDSHRNISQSAHTSPNNKTVDQAAIAVARTQISEGKFIPRWKVRQLGLEDELKKAEEVAASKRESDKRNSSERSVESVPEESARKLVEIYTRQKTENKLDMLIKEFYSAEDLSEAALCLEELLPHSAKDMDVRSELVFRAVCTMFEMAV